MLVEEGCYAQVGSFAEPGADRTSDARGECGAYASLWRTISRFVSVEEFENKQHT